MDFKLPEKCLVCDSPIQDQGHVLCLGCGKPCMPYAIDPEDLNMPENVPSGVNVKSSCCKDDVKLINIKATCSEKCHNKMLLSMESKIGKYIFDVDDTGVLRKIPTKDIFEKGGITMNEMKQYPKAETAGEA